MCDVSGDRELIDNGHRKEKERERENNGTQALAKACHGLRRGDIYIYIGYMAI